MDAGFEKTRKEIASVRKQVDKNIKEAQEILSDLEAKSGKTTMKPFKIVEFVNEEGLHCKATKQGEIVTILKPDNSTYQVPLKDFLKELAKKS